MSEIHLVVHISPSDTYAIGENLAIAEGEGVDGVFIISHDGGHKFVEMILRKLSECVLKMKIGVNFLDLYPEEGFALLEHRFNGNKFKPALWTDSAAIEIRRSKGMSFWPSVAFKYRRQPDDLVKAVKEAAQFGDVLVTSGEGTGKAPSLEKIITIKKASVKPIAVASGITPENVSPFVPYVDHFMVATGVSKDFLHFDKTRVNALVKAIRG
jgi:hypothetical protein